MSNSQAVTLANLRDQFKKALNEENRVTNLIKLIEEKTKVNREYIAYGKYYMLFIYYTLWKFGICVEPDSNRSKHEFQIP